MGFHAALDGSWGMRRPTCVPVAFLAALLGCGGDAAKKLLKGLFGN